MTLFSQSLQINLRISLDGTTQWGNKKYMSMKHLEAALEDTSIAG